MNIKNIEVVKYAGEKADEIMNHIGEALAKAHNEGRKPLILIEGPTGIGKTRLLEAISNKFKGISRVGVDQRLLGEQNRNKGIPFYSVDEVTSDIKFASVVYESLGKVMRQLEEGTKSLLFIDEAHTLPSIAINDRVNAIGAIDEAMSIASGTIHLTATAQQLKSIYNYDLILQIDNGKRIKPKTVKIINKGKNRTYHELIASQVNEHEGRSMAFINNVASLEKASKLIKDDNTAIITSKSKVDSVDYKSLTTEEMIKSNNVLNTSVVLAGININNDDVESVSFAPTSSTFNDLLQYNGRIRNGYDTLYVNVNASEKEYEVPSFEEMFDEALIEANEMAEAVQYLFKTSIKNTFITDIHTTINVEAFKKKGINVDIRKGTVKVVVEAVAGIVYDRYSRMLFSKPEALQQKLIEEGFDNVEIVNDYEVKVEETEEVKDTRSASVKQIDTMRETFRRELLAGKHRSLKDELGMSKEEVDRISSLVNNRNHKRILLALNTVSKTRLDSEEVQEISPFSYAFGVHLIYDTFKDVDVITTDMKKEFIKNNNAIYTSMAQLNTALNGTFKINTRRGINHGAYESIEDVIEWFSK